MPETPRARSSAASPTTAADVAEDLRRQIQDDVLQPGEWLREARLCTEFGIGRSIARAALRHLADDGLVRMEENRGAYVAATTLQEVFDLYEVRAALYGLAARFACIRSDPKYMAETLRMIDQIFVDVEGPTPAEDLIHQSEDIFSRLAATSSVDAQRMIESVRRKTRWHYSYLGIADRGTRPVAEWRVLREGLVTRNPAMAAEGARNILYFIQNEVMRLMISRGYGMQSVQTPPPGRAPRKSTPA
jgi:DNA-binding GntR family transcriptional regulator